VIEEFKRLFECEEATTPLEYHEKNWNEDEWSRGIDFCSQMVALFDKRNTNETISFISGCYFGYCPPGVLSSYGPALRKPCGRIFWAGTETATRWSGTHNFVFSFTFSF
jgi:monoamine oxidase